MCSGGNGGGGSAAAAAAQQNIRSVHRCAEFAVKVKCVIRRWDARGGMNEKSAFAKRQQ